MRRFMLVFVGLCAFVVLGVAVADMSAQEAKGAPPDMPPARKIPERPAPKMDPFKSIIDGWLEEDQKWPRKQRHTARRVWQRLVAEHGAEVGESTVRRYVKTVRERQSFPLVDVTVPQHHPLGS